MKAVGRPGLASNQRLSVGASLTIAALLGLFGTYRLVYRESADDDFLIDLGSATYLSSDGPRERPGKTERRTEAFNGDEKHRQYVKQIRDAEKEDKPLQLIFYGDDIVVEQFQGDCQHPGCASGPAVFKKYFGEWRSAAFGITGDKVKELAWRVMEGGEAPSDDAPPSVAVVHVGSHDLQGSDTVPGNQTEINAVSTDIINDIWYVLNFLRQNRPRMETLVVGLLPRGPEDGTESALRTTIVDVNKGLTKFCEIYDGVTFVDCTKPFRISKAKVDETLMPDLLHPNEQGLKLFSNCLKKALLPLLANVTAAKREDWVETRPSYQVQQTRRRR